MKHFSQLRNILFLSFSLTYSIDLSSQCMNTTQFPAEAIIAPSFNETITITSEQKTGEYFEIKHLILNKTYEFASSTGGDYITVRDASSGILLGHGFSPYSYTVGTGPDYVQVHINLDPKHCKTDTENRTTSATCADCQPIEPAAGVGTSTPGAQWDVAGEIRLGDSGRPATAGMLRWNSTSEDFEGYNGNEWISLTTSNGPPESWGLEPFDQMYTNQKLIADDGTDEDEFGYSVSISGDYAIIGVPQQDIGSTLYHGSAYIFYRNGNNWIQQSKIIAEDGGGGFFGSSVGISGRYAVVGRPEEQISGNNSQGSAYIYYRTGKTWTQQAKIIASDGKENDHFGWSVGISNDYIIVGTPYDDIDMYSAQGSAYLFHRSGTDWNQQAKITASDGKTDDNFGLSRRYFR
jgi:hypothetical protein